MTVAWSGERVAFMEKVWLHRPDGPGRGVELFNGNLVRDLAGLGIRLSVCAHPEWFAGELAGGVDLVSPQPFSGSVAGGLAAAVRLVTRGRFSVLLLGNVANGLIPALGVIRRCRAAARCVVIAHRHPSPRFLRALRAWRGATVVAVNGDIARRFREGGVEGVATYYGVTEAERFQPAAVARDDRIVHFCVVGQLDAPWKGADTAMAAFRALPVETRRRCRLHLAWFDHQPVVVDEGISVYGRIPFAQMPAFLQRMDVMLVPSRDEHIPRETFSQAMVQGMLSELPVIAGDVPVLTEKLDRGGGLVFRGADDLARIMGELASDVALRRRLGQEGRRTALERYVWRTSEFAGRFLAEASRGE